MRERTCHLADPNGSTTAPGVDFHQHRLQHPGRARRYRTAFHERLKLVHVQLQVHGDMHAKSQASGIEADGV